MRKCQPIATRRKYLLYTSSLRIEYLWEELLST
uniref:Uncharacterized protein n=1 Tax=Vitis vinifera TaxID=29760 RepID=F6GW02_VITVI